MRILHDKELETLHEEFISFLIVNGIDAVEWKNLKDSDLKKSKEIIKTFSFNYFSVMLAGINFIIYENESLLHTIHFRDLNRSEFILKKDSDPTIGYKEVPFIESREEDMFKLLEQGFTPSKGTEYKDLAMLFAKQ